VVSDPAFFRPLESGQTLADPAKAREKMGWKPEIGFEEMVAKMVSTHRRRLEKWLRTEG
jgi:GDPmannose 4,6-dehydratase